MDFWYHYIICFHIFTQHSSDAEMPTSLEDMYSRCERILQSSCVISHALWCSLHWSRGLNKLLGAGSPQWCERLPGAAQHPPGRPYMGSSQQCLTGSSAAAPGLSLHTNLRPFFSKSLLGYHSLSLHYTGRQETFFPPSYLKFRAHYKWQSGSHYELALVFSSCANCTVLMMILS